jgi:hypothetical protein
VVRTILLLFLLIGSVLPAGAHAQVGVTTDILTGTITGPDGAAVQNALVQAVSMETGVSRSTLTDARGRYTLIFPDGGGHYELRVGRIGLTTVRMVVAALPSEDLLVTDFQLDVAPVSLLEITVLADAERLSPGTSQAEYDGDWLVDQPIDPTNLATIAALEGAAVGLELTDSLGSGGFSILGQGPDQNHISVDGATFGGPRGGSSGELGLPAEAVRLTRVITNSYDVSQGQFSGGQISATTRGGTNRQQGSFTYSLYEPRLQFDAGSPFSRAYTQHRLSAGYGGPIIRDRFFYFVSGQARHRSQDFASLERADVAALEQLGAHPDSVARFLTILGDHELAPNDPVPVSQELIEEISLFARFDFTLSDRHSLMVRGDARANQRAGTRISSLGLPHSGGNDESSGGGAMLGLTSQFGANLVNEFRIYASRSDSDAAPYFPVPEGRVRVTSYQEDGTRRVTNLIFGGNRSLPVTSSDRTIEMSNELSWILGDRHRIKLGGLFSSNRSAQEYSSTQLGTFSFDSLEDFALNRPTSYSRSLTRSTRFGGGHNLALFLGDIWQYSRGLQLTYGLRLEGSVFPKTPTFNPLVEELFGRRTDDFPGEVHVTPRLGFTYSQAAPGRGSPSPMTIRGGMGVFRGRPPFSLFSTAIDATGLPDAQVQIVCIGDLVPTPDWNLYRSDPSLIPETCADGDIRERSSGRAPNVTLFASDFTAPRSFRASLEVERRLTPQWTVSLSNTYNIGSSNYGVSDLNLDATPRFTIANEVDRPVYVDPTAIVARNGSVSLMGSRIHPEFGQVLDIHSDLKSRSSQVAASVRGELFSRLNVRGSYTYARARDQTSFSCCAASQGFGSPTTDGDPNEIEWSRSNYERRHAFTTNLGLRVRPWVEITLTGRNTSGEPYTPLVGGDINGDGARNDRAFIFDPARVSEPELAAGLERLLTTSAPRIRECLAVQLGTIAARNSCRGPRTSSLELRANLRPESLPGMLAGRLQASIASQNLLTGIDQIVHGAGNLSGWGQRSTPDPTLLYPRGFDPETRTFRYEVNEGFGNPRQGRIPVGSPFQLHVEARITLGPIQPQRGGGGGGTPRPPAPAGQTGQGGASQGGAQEGAPQGGSQPQGQGGSQQPQGQGGSQQPQGQGGSQQPQGGGGGQGSGTPPQ